jgi:hypothetical protein
MKHEIVLSWDGDAADEEKILGHLQTYMARNAFFIDGTDIRLTIDGEDKTPLAWRGGS